MSFHDWEKTAFLDPSHIKFMFKITKFKKTFFYYFHQYFCFYSGRTRTRSAKSRGRAARVARSAWSPCPASTQLFQRSRSRAMPPGTGYESFATNCSLKFVRYKFALFARY